MRITKTILVTAIILINCIQSATAQSVLEQIYGGDIEAVKKIISESPDAIKAVDDNDMSALHYAAYSGNAEMMTYVLTLGLDVNCRDIYGFTPLHYAAAKGAVDVTRLLLDAGADPNAKSVEDVSPLHFAVRGGKMEIVGLLEEKGANLSAADHYGYTVLDEADRVGQESICSYLHAAGGKATSPTEPDIIMVTDRVYRLTWTFWQNSNIAALMLSDGYLLVDTGCSAKLVDKLKAGIAELNPGELKFVINSHKHWDHISGNAIAGDSVPVIDYPGLEQMVASGVLTQHDGPLLREGKDGFGTWYSLNGAGTDVLLIPWPNIHTENDILIWFRDEKVLFVGDLLIPQSFPSVSKKTGDYLAFLAKLIDVFPEDTTFMCGHGNEVTREEIADYRTMLDNVSTEVKAMIAEGKSIHEIRADHRFDGVTAYESFIPILNRNYWINAVYQDTSAKKE